MSVGLGPPLVLLLLLERVSRSGGCLVEDVSTTASSGRGGASSRVGTRSGGTRSRSRGRRSRELTWQRRATASLCGSGEIDRMRIRLEEVLNDTPDTEAHEVRLNGDGPPGVVFTPKDGD